MCNFQLPNTIIRSEIIRYLSPKIDNITMNKILPETEGYSGAHLKELVEFARLIQKDESCDMNRALLLSLEKLKKQKRLIAVIEAHKKKETNDFGYSEKLISNIPK